MNIEIVATNNHDVHVSEIAWGNSRPNNSPIPLDDILGLDLPVNEIPMVTLFIESTILEREIIVSARNHVMWAQTSRVQNVLEFTYPQGLGGKVEKDYENKRAIMKRMDAEGIRQDEYRKALPILANTKYTINISMRDLINLWIEMSHFALKYKHLTGILGKSCDDIQDVLEKVFRVNNDHMKSYKGKPLMRRIKTPNDGIVGNILSVTARIPFSLRAQLVRHRSLIIEDNLETLMSDESILFQNNEMSVDVCVTGLIDDWTEIIRKRSCWIAQYNLWSPLLNKAESFLKLGAEALPCNHGSCPYDGDAKARYTNEDPNAPCPIHTRLYDKALSSEQLVEIKEQFQCDERPLFWIDEINKFTDSWGE